MIDLMLRKKKEMLLTYPDLEDLTGIRAYYIYLILKGKQKGRIENILKLFEVLGIKILG